MAAGLAAAGGAAGIRSPGAKQYRALLEAEQAHLLDDIVAMAGRDVPYRHRYSALLNGFSVTLSEDEAIAVRAMPGVVAVQPVYYYRAQLDAGPQWIGAPAIWNGPAGLKSRGEGVVIGILDSGINWDSEFFSDVGGDGFNHTNPRGAQLGLCSDPAVTCNDKLIGVYDFTDEGTMGRDSNGHGSHVASIAAGNVLNFGITFPGVPQITFNVAGVANHANLIAYKVCENPPAGGLPSCAFDDIIAGLEQAMMDDVDVVNLSIGGSPVFDPWNGLLDPFTTDTELLLQMRTQGIVAASSAGNSGPQPGSVSLPASAPWVIAAGNITHNRLLGERLEQLTGGATPPPGPLTGAGITAGTAQLPIVHAADLGFPLCGIGAAELLTGCDGAPGQLTGASNPFPPGSLSGRIVVCDRGVYGRVEKGFNAKAAGAAGMVLANTALDGESIVSDQHCLPAVHIGQQDGDALRGWLASGANHRARISGTQRIVDDAFGDRLAASSSRGPNVEIAGVLKPDAVAPGTDIIGASDQPMQIAFLTGTSMASPHIAGSAALLHAVHPAWTPAQIHSALVTTAAAGSVVDENGGPAGRNDQGAGRLVLGAAVNAGLYLNTTEAAFRAADPRNNGGQAAIDAMNLPAIRIDDCFAQCTARRTVTDMQGGGTWNARLEGDIDGMVLPASFTLGKGASRALTVTLDARDPTRLNRWNNGAVVLESPGVPTQRLPLAVFNSPGELPDEWAIETAATRGSQVFSLSGLVAIDGASWRAGTLAKQSSQTNNSVPQDPTRDDPFDSLTGTIRELVEVPPGTAFLLARSTAASSALDVDLFVGRDLDGDGQPSEDEQLCASTSPTDIEECRLDKPEPGSYWLVYQNWNSNNIGASIAREHVVVSGNPSGNLFIQAQGIVAESAPFDLKLAFDEGRMAPGETWWGVVELGTAPSLPGNIGLIPVRLRRISGTPPVATLPLTAGVPRTLRLAGVAEHDRMFIDVPPGVSRLTVKLEGNTGQLQLARVPFDQAFGAEPFAAPAPANRPFDVVVAAGVAELVLEPPQLQTGRWYVVARNTDTGERGFTATATLSFAGPEIAIQRNNFASRTRQTFQGIEFNRVGSNYAFAWFTYNDDGMPLTYLGSARRDPGANTIRTVVNGFSGNGSSQAAHAIGEAILTFITEDELIFSYSLMGESGSEKFGIIAALTCPTVNGAPFNVTGHWTPNLSGQGGESLLINQTNQAYLFYFFGGTGRLHWLLGSNGQTFSANPVTTLVQHQGFCPLCPPVPVVRTQVGTLSHDITGNRNLMQTVDVQLVSPLNGILQATRPFTKLTDDNVCQ